MNKITGKDLIKWGFKPGEIFKWLLPAANSMKKKGMTYEEIRKALKEKEEENKVVLLEKRKKPLEWTELINVSGDVEEKNLEAVRAAMSVAMSVPVIKAGAILPDACPAGTAPVGSVIASDMIHPGLHSADICCSVACSEFTMEANEFDPVTLTDLALERTHFGVGTNTNVLEKFKDLVVKPLDQSNVFLKGLDSRARSDIGTQGDGNHFLYIGSKSSTGQLALVTHHGSRSLGAQVYKRGMQLSRKETSSSARNMGTLSWFDPNSEIGNQYWEALQYVRWWTKMNHLAIHDLVSSAWKSELSNDIKLKEFFWNEHNFIFKRDNTYLHAKGATPNYEGFSPDDSGKTLVPLNMGEPILILEHTDNEDSLGFAPHGAGRNMSRTQYLKGSEEGSHKYPEGVEVRFFTGKPDYSELPGAYKCSDNIRSDIEQFGIGKVVETIEPIGSIMAGKVEWKKKEKRRKPNGLLDSRKK